MSGTSGDGVSAAIVSFKNRTFKLLTYETFPYSPSMREKIRRALELRTPEISTLNFQLGRVFADAALKIIRKSRIRREKIAVIGSHGQTIYHGPRDRIPSTYQIGEAAVIAEKTGIPVVSDFRPQDIAAGGEGAPLIPFFDHYFYGGGPLRAFQNIGGIANVTIVGKGLKQPIAFDTGPGNGLIDLAIQKITKGKLSHDPFGKWAARGKTDINKVRSMMRHPFFRRQPPKSTGREEFGEGFFCRHFGASLSKRPFNVLATLTYFTALSIFESLRNPNLPITPPLSPSSAQGESVSGGGGEGKGGWGIKEMIVSGGGVKNLTLMHHLKELFSPLPVRSIEEWGIPAQAKEPMAFAFFALRALEGRINHFPSATGARHAMILGKLTNPGSVIAMTP